MRLPNIFKREKKSVVSSQKLFLMLEGELINYEFSSRELAKKGFIENIIAYRCISLIATQISTINYKLFEGEKQLDKHPLLDLLKSPYPMWNQAEFLEAVMTYLLIYGNSYIWMRSNDPGKDRIPNDAEPALIYPLRPDNMTVKAGQNFLPAYYDYQDQEDGNFQKLRFNVSLVGKSNIIQLKKLNPLNTFLGLSPILPAFIQILQHNFSGRWNYSLLKNSGRPSGALLVPKETVLQEKQIDRLKSQIHDQYSGPKNAGRPILLEGGVQWIPMGLSPTDMDFSTTEKAAAHKIALAFNVPLELLNTEQSKYDNLSAAYEQLWDEAVMPLVKQYIDELNANLVPRYGSNLTLQADLSNIQALMIKRARKMESMEKVSFLTINEKRNETGYEPIDNGNVLLLARNQVPATGEGDTTAQKNNFINREVRQGVSLEEAQALANKIYE